MLAVCACTQVVSLERELGVCAEDMQAWQDEDTRDVEYEQRQRATVAERVATRQRSNVRYESDMLHYKRIGAIDSEVGRFDLGLLFCSVGLRCVFPVQFNMTGLHFSYIFFVGVDVLCCSWRRSVGASAQVGIQGTMIHFYACGHSSCSTIRVTF